MHNKITLLIPAYQPSPNLLELTQTIINIDTTGIIQNILIVNDGSKTDSEQIFSALVTFEKVVVLRHAINLGKGAALKTGFNYAFVTWPDTATIVTADADGQHAPKDILRVAEESQQYPEKFILGARSFGSDVPFRSRFGNEVTRKVMWLFTGLHLRDTQTGLRAWPKALCLKAMRITTSGYEFEMDALLTARRQVEGGVPIKEIPIQTIYEKGNPTSHFNPILDSMRIYFMFLRYCSASFATAITDYVVFSIALLLCSSIGISMICGRTIAAFVSYGLNRNFVFYSKNKPIKEFVNFISVVVVFGVVAYLSILELESTFGMNVFGAKLLVEFSLFFIGFAVLNSFIFRKENSNLNQTDWDSYYNQKN